MAKKPFRNSVSWDNINAVNTVFGNRTIKIGNHTYKIRLMKGKTEGKQNDQSGSSGTIHHNSEWNRLMLPIHKNAPSNWKYKDNVDSPTENWGIGYTDTDLITHLNAGNGSYVWCQECGNGSSNRLMRGGNDISYSAKDTSSVPGTGRGWRPVLELVD